MGIILYAIAIFGFATLFYRGFEMEGKTGIGLLFATISVSLWFLLPLSFLEIVAIQIGLVIAIAVVRAVWEGAREGE